MSSGQEVGEIFGEGSGPAAALLRSPTVIIAGIALWGMNVYFFRIFGIDYSRVLLLDVKKEEEHEKEREKEKENVEEGAHSGRRMRKRRGKDGTILVEVPTSEHAVKTMSSNTLDSIDGIIADDESDASMEVIPLSDTDSNLSPNNSITGKMSDYDITETKLFSLAAVLMFTLNLTSQLWIRLGNGSTIGAIFLFYTMVIFSVLLPFQSTSWVRLAIKTIFWRAKELVNPRCLCFRSRTRPIPFIDVFFADGMCSMSKVFFDWGMLWLLASYYPNPVPASAKSIIIPSCFASLPYLIRARQCLVMYSVGLQKKDPKRYQHILNAIKYSTSLFPLILSAFQKTESGQKIKDKLEIVLIILLVINATYSLVWDITMDWGMMQKPSAVVHLTMGPCAGMSPVSNMTNLKSPDCGDIALRPRLRFGTSLSLLVLVLDTLLRFSWTLRFYEPYIFASNGAYILCTEFLEVFRRAVWNLLRVEWEQIKQNKAMKAAEKEDGIMLVNLKHGNGSGLVGSDSIIRADEDPSVSSTRSGSPSKNFRTSKAE